MIRLLLILILLLPIPARAIEMIGFGAAVGGCGACASPTKDQSFEGGGSTTVTTTSTAGQSFTPSVTKCLESVELYVFTADGDETVTIRIDNDTDMTSEYLVEVQETLNTAVGGSSDYWHKFEIPAESRPSLTASTTYYMFWQTSGSNWTTYETGGNLYPGGVEYYTSSVVWTGLTSYPSYDLRFRANMCE